ncbi:MAG: phage tail tape measure protein, partial [Candidatus Paceibacterota bacterium]
MIKFSEIFDFNNPEDLKKAIDLIQKMGDNYERLIKLAKSDLSKVNDQQKKLTTSAKKLGETYNKKTSTIKDYATAAENLFKQDQQLTSQQIRLTGVIQKLSKEKGTVVSRTRETIKLQNDEIKLRQKLNSADSKQAQNNAKLKIRIQEKNKALKEAAKESLNMVTIYDRETKKLIELRKRYKAVALQEGINSKTAKELRRQVLALDATLKQVDQTAGQSQRNVGNYGKALMKFNEIIASLGIIGGTMLIGRALKSLVTINKEFEKSLSSLSSITGATGDDLKFFSDEAKRMGATTTQSASQVVKAFEIVGSKKPELLKSKEALAAVTEEAIALAEASGMDVPAAAEALTGALNQFGEGASEASRFINVLAAGSKEGASGINQSSEALKVFGTVAADANIPVERSIGLVQTLAEKQIEGSQAGTNLRNVILKLQTDQANYKNGVFDMQFALERLNKANLSATELTKQFGVQNVTAAKILIDGTETVDRYTKAVTDTNTAYEQQATNTDNLQGSMDSLNSVVESLVLSFNSDGGLTGALRAVIDFTSSVIKQITALNMTLNEFKLSELSDEIKAETQAQIAEFKTIAEEAEKSGRDATDAVEHEYNRRLGLLEQTTSMAKKELESFEEENVLFSNGFIQAYKSLGKEIPEEHQKLMDTYSEQQASLKALQSAYALLDTKPPIKEMENLKGEATDLTKAILDLRPIKLNSEINTQEVLEGLQAIWNKRKEFGDLDSIFGEDGEETGYLDQLDMIAQKEAMTNDQRLRHYKNLQDALINNTNLTEKRKLELHQQYESEITRILENESERRMSTMEMIGDFASATFTNIMTIFSNIGEKRLNELDVELESINRNKEAIQDRYDLEMALAGDNADTQEELAARKEERLAEEREN